MLKDSDKMIYSCDKCGMLGSADLQNIFCWGDYSAHKEKYRTLNADLHLCKPCYMQYYKKRDDFIDAFLKDKDDPNSL